MLLKRWICWCNDWSPSHQYFITSTLWYLIYKIFNHIAIFGHWAAHSIHGLKGLFFHLMILFCSLRCFFLIMNIRLPIARKSPIDCCWITKVNEFYKSKWIHFEINQKNLHWSWCDGMEPSIIDFAVEQNLLNCYLT